MEDYERYLAEARRLAQRLGIPEEEIPTREVPAFEGTFVRVSGGTLELVDVERGRPTATRMSGVDELLYQVFRQITWNMACRYELLHRRRGEDFRRQLFAEHERLLGELRPAWAEAIHGHYERVLESYPFNDQMGRWSDRVDELMARGMSREEAAARANADFPLAASPSTRPAVDSARASKR
jgi:Immunity protein 63